MRYRPDCRRHHQRLGLSEGPARFNLRHRYSRPRSHPARPSALTYHCPVAPSAIVSAIQATGRDAILRGSGQPNSAAVAILETHAAGVADPVRGLARLVQVSPTATIVDLTVKGVAPGHYFATLRENGDISRGAASTGGVWAAPRGELGSLEVGESGVASALLVRPTQVWELLGRGFVLSKKQAAFATNDVDTLVGVVARSAGVWENEKTVCACSGKTVWEEREEQVGKGLPNL